MASSKDTEQDSRIAEVEMRNQLQQQQLQRMGSALSVSEVREGEWQRLRMHVPTANSTLTLGNKYPQSSYTGFSVRTGAHVFLQARGDKGKQKSYANIQSAGPFLAQTESNAVVAAKKTAALSGVKNALVTGLEGVNIVAGASLDPDIQDAQDSDGVPPPTLAGAINDTATAIGAAVGAALSAWSPVKGTVKPKSPLSWNLANWLSAFSTTFGLGTTALVEACDYAGAELPLDDSVNIAANRNVNINGAQNAGLTSLVSAGMLSAFTGVVGTASCGVFGGVSTEVGSQVSTAVLGGKSVEVASGKETIVSTGPKGKSAFLQLEQSPPKATLETKKAVNLRAGDGSTVSMHDGAGLFQANADKNITLRVGDSFEIKITNGEIVIGKKDGEPIVEISDKKGIDIKGKKKSTMHAGDSHVAVKPDKVSVHGKSKVTIQGSEVTANGKKIKLG